MYDTLCAGVFRACHSDTTAQRDFGARRRRDLTAPSAAHSSGARTRSTHYPHSHLPSCPGRHGRRRIACHWRLPLPGWPLISDRSCSARLSYGRQWHERRMPASSVAVKLPGQPPLLQSAPSALKITTSARPAASHSTAACFFCSDCYPNSSVRFSRVVFIFRRRFAWRSGINLFGYRSENIHRRRAAAASGNSARPPTDLPHRNAFVDLWSHSTSYKINDRLQFMTAQGR